MERFKTLVAENNGFEFVQAFREEEDHLIGGKDDTYWYVILKDGWFKESFVGTLKEGVWCDVHIKGKGKRQKKEEVAPGTTMNKIVKNAYLCQDEEWVMKRKPRLIEDAHPHYHYTYGFGDKALDVSEAFGVTIGYSDLKDVPAGFHLRYLYVGDEVEKPY